MRRLGALLLLIAVVPGTLLREVAPPTRFKPELRFVPVPLPPAREAAKHLGAFRLDGIWEMRSRRGGFGGYSALVALGHGQLLTVRDRGDTLRFAVPGTGGTKPGAPPIFATLVQRRGTQKASNDAESATRDPLTGQLWIGWEHTNAISRHDPDLMRRATVRPRQMRGWGGNSGAEAMVRLRGGRFIVLSEGFAARFDSVRHPAVLFSCDPTRRCPGLGFTFEGPAGFSPTDMTELPDGRVLVLMRRLVWPFPLRFAGRIAIADPAELRAGRPWRAREVAKLTSTLPVDNFEGIAVEPRGDGTVTVWLISDYNDALTQRILLWQLRLDPKEI